MNILEYTVYEPHWNVKNMKKEGEFKPKIDIVMGDERNSLCLALVAGEKEDERSTRILACCTGVICEWISASGLS